ncbi:hypothetical protein [Salinispora vitiensis]|uniref:hypothetical protein n=1 Tax=Salinispora vitiensis TaxID=999544 RepID=UPI0003690973|nr:hypothetical protein [Salinispora vitiensis]
MNPVSENLADELAELDKEDFALPVTDAFVTRVHHGVRRRRILRAGVAGGAVAATAIAVTVTVSLSGITQSAPLPNSSTGPSVAAPPTFVAYPLYQPLDGYRVTSVPEGLRAYVAQFGPVSYAVSKNQLHNDSGVPTPTGGGAVAGSDHPTATTTYRNYVRPNGANWLWISVLRPERTTAEVDRAQVTEWLVGWAIKGTEVIDSFPVPAGQAQLTRTGGSEVTVHAVVITTPSGTVIDVSGNGAVPVADLRAVAAGIFPP